MPTRVLVKLRHDDFPHESVVMLERVRTIEKSRLLDYICTLPPAKMDEIDRALAVSLGLPMKSACEQESNAIKYRKEF